MYNRYMIGVLLGLLSLQVYAQRLARPSAVQMEWQQMETTAFIHFSVNTFTDMEWGYGNESPSIFNPTRLDCRQWIRTCKEAGIKGVILTAKHHDGFCLWPSAYTEHSVKNAPWKNGKGDLVREFVDACHEYGLKVGLYLSPWDCNHPDYGKPAYITYFKNQLRELLTNYGELYEFWFDGANGGRGYYGTDSLHHRKITADYYPWEEITRMVYELQPNCVVHGGALANIRWVGNEEGYAQEEHWSVMRAPELYNKDVRINLQLMRGHADGTIWKPSEVDVSIRPGWYYHAAEDHLLKSVSRLTDIYYESVGRNSLLLLNLPPNKCGLIPSQDSLHLVQWRQRYTSELSQGLLAPKTRIVVDGKKVKAKLTDGKRETCWTAGSRTPVIEFDFGGTLTFNRLLLQEYIEKGQRVKHFMVEYYHDGQWHALADQTTIGYKRLLRFPETKAERLRVRVIDAWDVPCLSEIQLYYADTPLDEPVIRRGQDGSVRLFCTDHESSIYYTTDGTEPSATNGHRYQEPFVADGNQTVKAIAVNGGKQSVVATRAFSGSKRAWTTNPAKAAATIFDENDNTAWVGDRQVLEIDVASVRSMRGFRYLPHQSRWAQGIITRYAVEISVDGERWEEVATGEFGNIRNSPTVREVTFSREVQGRYIRFRALDTVDGKANMGVAAFDIIF